MGNVKLMLGCDIYRMITNKMAAVKMFA